MALTDALKNLFSNTPPGEPEAPRHPWPGNIVPRETGPGKSIKRSGEGGGIRFSGTVRLEWVSRETDGEGTPLYTRTPREHTATEPEVGFIAAGRMYSGLSSLTTREVKDSPWAKDVFGRDVLALKERFPCFDSSDYRYETRYFRWYFLCEGEKLTCVYHTDGTHTVTVTEDVQDVERDCWRRMRELGCFSHTEP